MTAPVITVASVQPLTIPSNEDATAYEGFVHLPGAGSLQTALWLKLSAIPKDRGSLSGAQLNCSIELSDLIEGHEDIIESRLADSPDVPTFFLELTALLERLLCHRPPLEAPASTFYSGLVDEIEAMGWQYIPWICPNLSALHLSITDSAGRQHTIKMQLPASYPLGAPLVQADLPEEVPTLTWQPGKSTLLALRQHYEEVIEQLQDLWACLADIDREAWVLEPDKATPGQTFRRLALGSHCSLLLALQPHHPRELPAELYVSGPESAARPLQVLIERAPSLWDVSRLPRENVEAILQMRLPCKALAAQEDMTADCCICYAYRLPSGNPAAPGSDAAGEVPDEACPNARCGRPFHRRCLLEWLLAVSTSRRSFNTVFGVCPYCSQPVTARIV